MNDLASRPFYAGEWRIDPPRGRLSIAAREFKLEPNAMAVLVYLASRQGSVVSKQELLNQVWEGRAVSDDVLTVSIYRLRRILGDSAQDPRFIATVPRKGYRWILPVSDHPENGDSSLGRPRHALPGDQVSGEHRSAAANPAAASPRRLIPSRRLRSVGSWVQLNKARRAVLIGGVLLLSIAVGGLGWRSLARTRPVGPPSQARSAAAVFEEPARTESTASLAVLPFTDLGPAAEFAFFAEGLSTELVDILVRSKELQVSGRASSAAAQREGWTIPQIGTHLAVRYVLEGSVQKDEEQLRVTVQLSDAVTGFSVWSERYARELGDVFDLQSEIATSIAETLDLQLPYDPIAATVRWTPTNMESYDSYLRGRYHLHQGGRQQLLQATAYFERAIEIDADYAAAYSGLADTYLLLPIFSDGSRRTYLEKARVAADRALALDGQLAEAHASRAEVVLWLDRDVVAAEEGLRRAIELDPHYPTAHHWLGDLLYWRRGRVQEALDHIRMAERIDPLNLRFKKALGHILLESGSVQEAQSKFLEAEAADPNSPEAIWGLARCSFVQRRYGEAIEYIERFLRLERDGQQGYFRLDQMETLTAARHFLGDHEQELRDALSAQQAAPGDPWALLMEARARSALGQPDAVRALVTRMLEMPRLGGKQARWWLRLVAELHWHGDPETAGWVASSLASWYRERVSTSCSRDTRLLRFRALALWVSGQGDEVEDLVPATLGDPHDRGSRRSDPVYLGEAGSLAALAGDQATAERFSALLDELESKGDALFWQAAIAASSGEHSRAVHLLRQSFESGFTDHAAVHSSVFFIDLYDYRPFHQLAEHEWGWPPRAATRS